MCSGETKITRAKIKYIEIILVLNLDDINVYNVFMTILCCVGMCVLSGNLYIIHRTHHLPSNM